MIVLGVDPGFSVTGFGIIKKHGQSLTILDSGALKLSTTAPLSERIGLFHDFFVQKIEQWGVEALALETPFLGKNAQNFLKLGYLRGILYLLADRHSLLVEEFAPREIKLAVTGYGGASKEQVARVLCRLFRNFQIPATLDTSDALAVTLCGVWKINTLSKNTQRKAV